MRRLLSAFPAELRTSRLLVVYLAIGLVVGLVTNPLSAVVDYLFLAGYAALIVWWLRNDAHTLTSVDDESPANRRDVVVLVLVALLAFAAVSWFWFGPRPRQPGAWVSDRLRSGSVDLLLAVKVGTAVNALILLLVPAIVVTSIARLRPRQIALVPRKLGLALVLSLLAVALGLTTIVVGQPQTGWHGNKGPLWSIALFLAQACINGLPEEFIFRGVILSRLLRLFSNPGTALVLSSVLFSAFHVPSILGQSPHPPWWQVVPYAILSPGYQPTGLIWGYLCYRTRSIWPGVLWHTSSTVFGVSFW
jgi:membrane protease YdiL (CAAX protease family)